MVEDSLKREWSLYLDGDEYNLPKIISKVGKVDIFHYDSDKSYSGREFAISAIKESLSDRGIILMDDLQDNSFFYDYIQQNNPKSWRVFKFHKKYVGMIGGSVS